MCSVYWRFCRTHDRWSSRGGEGLSDFFWWWIQGQVASWSQSLFYCLLVFTATVPPIHLNERYSRRCHNSQAAHAGWRLLGSADSTPQWLLSSFPSWVGAYLLSNNKTNHSQFLPELFILVSFILENLNSAWCVNTWWKLAPWHLRIRPVLASCSKQSESITEKDLTRKTCHPSAAYQVFVFVVTE